MASIKVNTGSVRYTIEDEDGEILGEIKFCPTDPGIIARLNTVAPKLTEVMGKIKECDENNLSELATVSDAAVREQFDFLFGRPVSDVLFSTVHPLATLDYGIPYFISVFNGIAETISKESEQRFQKMEERINAATAGYDDD